MNDTIRIVCFTPTICIHTTWHWLQTSAKIKIKNKKKWSAKRHFTILTNFEPYPKIFLTNERSWRLLTCIIIHLYYMFAFNKKKYEILWSYANYCWRLVAPFLQNIPEPSRFSHDSAKILIFFQLSNTLKTPKCERCIRWVLVLHFPSGY